MKTLALFLACLCAGCAAAKPINPPPPPVPHYDPHVYDCNSCVVVQEKP